MKIDVLSDEEVAHSGLINIVGEEVDNAYLKEIKTVTINQELINEMGKIKISLHSLTWNWENVRRKGIKTSRF